MSVTAAERVLRSAGIGYAEHHYEYLGLGDVGRDAAKAIGVDPAHLFKTLVVTGGGKHAMVLVPSSMETSFAEVARLLSRTDGAWRQRAEMASIRDAERLTGYQVGGISALGARRRLPVVVDETATSLERLYVNGGRRGLILSVPRVDFIAVVCAIVGPVGR